MLISGCTQEREGKYTGPVEKITVAAFEGDSSALIYIAESQGFFENNGLDVTIKRGLTDATEVPNYLDYIYFDALEEVKPEAIGIIS